MASYFPIFVVGFTIALCIIVITAPDPLNYKNPLVWAVFIGAVCVSGILATAQDAQWKPAVGIACAVLLGASCVIRPLTQRRRNGGLEKNM